MGPAAADELIAFFNARRMDLPNGLFDRKTQFIINGASFESLLSETPEDPLVLMLARGPAGYRFTVKALQHAIPDARIDKGDVSAEASATSLQLRLSGRLRGTGERINTLVEVAVRLTDAGVIEVAEATVDSEALQKIREARLRP